MGHKFRVSNLHLKIHAKLCIYITLHVLHSFSSPENMRVTSEITTACVNEKYPASVVQSKSLSMQESIRLYIQTMFYRSHQEILHNSEAALASANKQQTSRREKKTTKTSAKAPRTFYDYAEFIAMRILSLINNHLACRNFRIVKSLCRVQLL